MRGYMATLILGRAGLDAVNLAAGYKTDLRFHP
jgi:hypothetical protein